LITFVAGATLFESYQLHFLFSLPILSWTRLRLGRSGSKHAQNGMNEQKEVKNFFITFL
jgi:hypothetical protein